MDGNEQCLAESAENAVSSLLTTDGIVTATELPILQDGSTLVGPDGTVVNGSTVLGIPIIRDNSFFNAASQGIVITDADGTRTFLLDPSQITVLTDDVKNATTVYGVDNSIISTEVISVAENLTEQKIADDCNDPSKLRNAAVLYPSDGLVNDKPTSSFDTSDVQPPIGKGPFKCDYCDTVLQKWLQYKRHIKTHADDKPFKCTKCSASFNLQINHRLHMATHEPENPICPICGKKFSRLASLKAHIMFHEENDNLSCPTCLEEFPTQIKLAKHVKKFHDDKTDISCKQCNLTFESMYDLREHMKSHYKFKASLNNRAFKKHKPDRSKFSQTCPVCEKSFKKPSQLLRHSRIHTGEKPFVCHLCDKAFNQKGSLTTHKLLHYGNKPFKCDFCLASFAQKGNLRAHIKRLHDISEHRSISYPCQYCSCIFRKLGHLNSHLSKMHDVSPPTSTVPPTNDTSDCNKDEDKNSNMNDVIHELLKHVVNVDVEKTEEQIRKMAEEGNVNVDILQQAVENSGLSNTDQDKAMVKVKNLAQANNVKNKVMSSDGVYHPRRLHKCSYCSKEFKKSSDLVRHIRVHTHEKPFKCNECFRAFSLKSTLVVHLRSHMGIKTHQCNQCDKKFSTASGLKVHIRLHTGAKPYDCHICCKKFRTPSHLKSHIATHSKSMVKTKSKMAQLAAQIELLKKNDQLPEISLREPILITDSGFVKTQPKLVSTVQDGNQLSGDRPFVCNYCQRAFKKSSHLKQHIRSHTGEKPFKCNLCLHSFVSNGVLKEHLKTHSGVKTFKCDVCAMMFMTSGSLKRHMSTHSDARPFMCPYCMKTFKTPFACKKHMKIHKLEIALKAAQANDPSKQGTDLQDCNIITFSEFNADAAQQAADPLNTHQEFMLHSDSFTTESLTQLQHTLEQQVFEQPEMANIVTTTMQAVGQSPVTNIENVVVTQQTDKDAESSATYATAVPQTITEIPTSATSVTYDQNGVTNTFTISLPPLNSQFAIQNNTLDISELTSELQNTANEEQVVFDNTQSQSKDIEQMLQKSIVEEHVVDPTHKQTHTEHVVNEKEMETSKNTDVEVNHDIIFKCVKCSQEFESDDLLKAHAKTHRNTQKQSKATRKSKDLKCTVCNTCFASNHALTLHMNSHKKTKCYACDETFKNNVEFQKHVHEKHSDLLSKIPVDYEPAVVIQEGVADVQIPEDRTRKKCRSQGNIIRLSDEQAKAIAMQNPDDVSMLSEKLLIVSASQKDRVSEIKNKDEINKEQKYANKCDLCPKSFKKTSDLIRHVRIHTGEKPFICAICTRAFTVKSTLDNHMLTHSLKKKHYNCHVCGSNYSTKNSLKIHMSLHTGAKPFKCLYCPQRFRTSNNRKRHMLTHQGSEASDKKSDQADNAAVEQIVVEPTNESNQVILSSNQITVDQNTIQQLIQTNPNINVATDIFNPNETQFMQTTGVEGIQFQGPLIGSSGGIQLDSFPFQIDSNLLQQLQEQGNINITFNNPIQNFMPTSDANLLQTSNFVTTSGEPTDHENTDGGNTKISVSDEATYQVGDEQIILQSDDIVVKNDKVPVNQDPERKHVCDICDKSFKRAYHLKTHKKTHLDTKTKSKSSHLCSYCDKTFEKLSQLHRHVRIHTGERPYVCTVCNKSFNQTNALQTHMKNHTGERPYMCTFCSLTFSQKCHLKTHVLRVHPKEKKQAEDIPDDMLQSSSFIRQEPQLKSISGEADLSQNADYLDGVGVSELFPQ